MYLFVVIIFSITTLCLCGMSGSSASDEATFMNPFDVSTFSSDSASYDREKILEYELKIFVDYQTLPLEMQIKNKKSIQILNEMPILIRQKCLSILTSILSLNKYEQLKIDEKKVLFLFVLFEKIDQFYSLERVKFLFYTQKVLQNLICDDPIEIIQRLFEFLKSSSIEKACFCIDNINYLCGINSISPSHRRVSWPSGELLFSSSQRRGVSPQFQEIPVLKGLPKSAQTFSLSPLGATDDKGEDRLRIANMSFLSEQAIHDADDYFQILNVAISLKDKHLSKSVDDTLKLMSKYPFMSAKKMHIILKKMGVKNELFELYDSNQRKKMDLYIDKKITDLFKLCPKTVHCALLLDTVIESISPYIYEKKIDYVRWQFLITESFLSAFNTILKNTEHDIKIVFAFVITNSFYHHLLAEYILNLKEESSLIQFLDLIYANYEEKTNITLESYLGCKKNITFAQYIEINKKEKTEVSDAIGVSCSDFSTAVRVQKKLDGTEAQEKLNEIIQTAFLYHDLFEKTEDEIKHFAEDLKKEHHFSKKQILKIIKESKDKFTFLLLQENNSLKEMYEDQWEYVPSFCCFSSLQPKKINERDINNFMKQSEALNTYPFLKKTFKNLVLNI